MKFAAKYMKLERLIFKNQSRHLKTNISSFLSFVGVWFESLVFKPFLCFICNNHSGLEINEEQLQGTLSSKER